jgi:hypothetical protein
LLTTGSLLGSQLCSAVSNVIKDNVTRRAAISVPKISFIKRSLCSSRTEKTFFGELVTGLTVLFACFVASKSDPELQSRLAMGKLQDSNSRAPLGPERQNTKKIPGTIPQWPGVSPGERTFLF